MNESYFSTTLYRVVHYITYSHLIYQEPHIPYCSYVDVVENGQNKTYCIYPLRQCSCV